MLGGPSRGGAAHTLTNAGCTRVENLGIAEPFVDRQEADDRNLALLG